MAVCLFCLATAGAGVLAYAKVAGEPQDAQQPERALKGAQTPAANPVAQQPMEEAFTTKPPLDKDHVKTMLRASNFTDRMKSLLEARHEAAATEFHWRWRRFVEGKEMQSTLIEACLRLLEAERELSDRKADGLTVLKNHLERVREIEKIVKLKLEAGSAAFQDMAEATFRRVQAEIWIERQKAQ
jgi:hypothetical protein